MEGDSARVCGGFVALALLIRLGLINVNHAEYTDGILAVVGARGVQSFWPPLYGWLCAIVGLLGPGPEQAGRLVSALSGALVIVPIYAMARALGGARAAFWACLWWLVSPMALRWSLRMMTDALFALLFFGALWAMGAAWRRRRAGGFASDPLLAVATALTVAAMLTRYQGALLIAPLVFCLVGVRLAWRQRGVGPRIWTVCAQLLWLILAGWLVAGRDQLFAHGGQFASRAAGETWAALAAYWNVFESFALLSPYFFAYPVFALAVWGAIAARERFHLGMFAFVALALVSAQAVFQSFQERYLLPLLPFVVVYAGVGSARFAACCRPRWLWSAAMALGVAYCYVFALAVVVCQAGVFGDIKSAARYVAQRVPAETPVYSNESYGPQRVPIKMRFWSGRDDVAYWSPLGGNAGAAPPALPPGAVVCVHDLVGDQAYGLMLEHLTRRHHVRQLRVFERTIVPLLPEVMDNPVANQNPLGWVLRYTPQHFETSVFEIVSAKE